MTLFQQKNVFKMSSESPQFDILLGGSEELPQDLTVLKYASNRAQEILSLTEALQEPRKTGLMFQRLPRHMRRRVMSHNAKRMPRQLREAHISQMEKSGLPPKSKRPSRKYRRRPSNLLDAYNRRQKENIWLETHIWHAKRFHMTSKWGYKLANFPNDKSKRACYRAAANHCLIQDISYYKCIELKGEYESIINGLKLLTRDECGRTFCAKSWQKGDQEGSVTLFYSDSKYPCGAIGQVLFLWKPMAVPNVKSSLYSSIEKYQEPEIEMEFSESKNERTIWIWVHPSYYGEVKEELMKVFKMKLCSSVDIHGDDIEPAIKKVKLDNSSSELKGTHLHLGESVSRQTDLRIFSHLGPHYEGRQVQMTLLEDKLVRLRLTGPLSQAILRETFILAPEIREINEDIAWMEEWENIFKHQRENWERMMGFTSPAMVSPHVVVGLTILDPRCNLPEKRTKAIDQDVSGSDLALGNLSLEVSSSPIWDPKIREYSTKSKPKDVEINERQSGKLVPGISIDAEENISGKQEYDMHTKVPILLIQRPGSQDSKFKRLGYCCGWDIIAPAGWGKPLWLALVLRGARAGGLREAEMVEDIGFSHSLCWPPLPDTNAAKVEMKQQEVEKKEKYFRLPPNKRSNYVKLGISSPFSCPWEILCREWSNCASRSGLEYYVLRDNSKLKQISKFLHAVKSEKNSKRGTSYGVEEKETSPEEWFSMLTAEIESENDQCLIPVRVTVCKKGTVNDFAIICIPSKEDCVRDSKGNMQMRGVEEPSNKDINQNERKELRKAHKQSLARLRRKRVKQCKESDQSTPVGGKNVMSQPELSSEDASRRPLMGPAATAKMRKEYTDKMEGLFLPPCMQVRKSCSREVAGYVTHGVFSFSDAKELGMAYVTLPALQYLIKTKFWNPKLLVLIRNTHCKHYAFAEIEIITN